MKKLWIISILAVFILSLVSAQSLDIEFPQGDKFEPGNPITFKVTLYDDSGNTLDGEIQVTIEDAERRVIIERTVSSKEVVTVDLGEKATSGQGVIKARYQGTEAISFFDIGRNELALFELEGNTLKITNIGNTKYSRVITITIGGTIGTKEPELEPGESVSYRLVAPEGTYNIRVSDGNTNKTYGSIPLTGTGQAIGAIDTSSSERSPFTGGISPDGSSDVTLLSYLRNNTFVYVFIIVIFAAMILVAIERNYRKKSRR